MKFWRILVALSCACLNAEEARFFRGLSSDSEWPHRYVFEVRGDDVVVHVEQKFGEEAPWSSWGKEVKTKKVAKGNVSFSCPWGGPGKALPIACVFKFERISAEGFKAVLTVESFEKDKERIVEFKPISKKELAPSIESLVGKESKGAKDD